MSKYGKNAKNLTITAHYQKDVSTLLVQQQQPRLNTYCSFFQPSLKQHDFMEEHNFMEEEYVILSTG